MLLLTHTELCKQKIHLVQAQHIYKYWLHQAMGMGMGMGSQTILIALIQVQIHCHMEVTKTSPQSAILENFKTFSKLFFRLKKDKTSQKIKALSEFILKQEKVQISDLNF